MADSRISLLGQAGRALKHRRSRFRAFRFFGKGVRGARFLSLLASSSALLSCGADMGSESDQDSLMGETELDLTPSEFCSAVNSIGTISLGSGPTSATITPDCENDSGSELSYLGSTAPTSFAGSVSRVLGQTLYCSLTGSHNVDADGTISTGVGKFGIKSRMNVYKSDPKTLKLSAQRVGRLYAFGIEFDLENQDFHWNFVTAASNPCLKAG